MSDENHMRELINIHYRRLHELKKKEALYGQTVDPSTSLEIENIQAEIEKLQIQLEEIIDFTDTPSISMKQQIYTQPEMNVSEDKKSQHVDFLIVTPLEEERDAVLSKLPNYEKLKPIEDDIHTYFQSNLPTTSGNDSYHIIVMPLLGMGRVQAATATSDAIRQWNPRYVILVGIAGGVKARGVQLGDILVPDKIVDYELQKQTAKGIDIRWEVYPVSSRLLGAVQNFMNESWLSLIDRKRPRSGQPRRYIGPIASGDKVIDFAEALEKYRETWSKLIGVEMEAGGVALSTIHAEKQAKFFMIRGVSDSADGAKNSPYVKKWRSYACDVAAAYTIALLKSVPVPLLSSKKDTVRNKKPKGSVSLDTKIILVLYEYFIKHPGYLSMNFNNLIETSEANREDVIRELRRLREFGWVDFNLTSSGFAGEVSLTSTGIKIAEDTLRK